MVVFDIYSNRLKAEQHQNNDVYVYNEISEKLIVQIFYVAKDLLGLGDSVAADYMGRELLCNAWRILYDVLSREWGKYFLNEHPLGIVKSFQSYLFNPATSYSDILDFIDGIYIVRLAFGRSKSSYYSADYDQEIQEATEELNERFRMVGVGYQIENKKVIRIDHQHIHKEIVKPALAIINNPVFEKVNEDYRAAHEHYRNQHVKDCITACNRAFESMLKAICTEYQWSYEKGGSASHLIGVVRKEGLFQDNMDKTFDSFIATLKTGVPELRNQLGGHGSDPQTESPPLYMAAYLLHLTATNIIFLYEAFKAYKPDRE